jgi:hypothetical protein
MTIPKSREKVDHCVQSTSLLIPLYEFGYFRRSGGDAPRGLHMVSTWCRTRQYPVSFFLFYPKISGGGASICNRDSEQSPYLDPPLRHGLPPAPVPTGPTTPIIIYQPSLAPFPPIPTPPLYPASSTNHSCPFLSNKTTQICRVVIYARIDLCTKDWESCQDDIEVQVDC